MIRSLALCICGWPIARCGIHAISGRRVTRWRPPLVGSARSTEQLREAETDLRTTGAKVVAHAADVGNPDNARRLIEATVAAHGGIDILVNNVGGGGGGAHIADSTDDDWRGALERNLIQTVRMMRLVQRFRIPASMDQAAASI